MLIDVLTNVPPWGRTCIERLVYVQLKSWTQGSCRKCPIQIWQECYWIYTVRFCKKFNEGKHNRFSSSGDKVPSTNINSNNTHLTTWCKLNGRKTFRTSPRHLLEVLCMFCLSPVPREMCNRRTNIIPQQMKHYEQATNSSFEPQNRWYSQKWCICEVFLRTSNRKLVKKIHLPR